MLDKITVKYSVSFGKSTSVSGSMQCHINPGWKSWITFKPKLLRVEGKLHKYCWSSSITFQMVLNRRRRDTHETSSLAVIETPIRRSNGDEDGVLSCKTAPIANIYDANSTHNT